jgi:hypothetical protein
MKMRLGRRLSGIGLGTLAVAGLFASSVLFAQESQQARAPKRQVPAKLEGFGGFTPAAADPKLAAMLARSGLSDAGFRFTPSESRRRVSPTISVASHARSTRVVPAADRANPAPVPVALAPVAYNLGVSVAWKRFEVSGDLSKVDLVTQPGGSRERADVGLSYTGKRAGGRIQAGAERPLTTSAPSIGDNSSYSIDVGGSYKLTRNFALTAGVRYKAERERLPRLDEQRRDSQSVYVGTAFRF